MVTINGGPLPFLALSFKAIPRGREGKMNLKQLNVELARAAG
jgi:hypothetical protein